MTAIEPKTEKYLYEFEDFRVDPVRRRLLRAGEPVPLTPKAFSILLVLLEKRGEVVEKEELIQKVWPDTYVTEANLTQNISSLRKALGERAQDSRLVLTVPGQGYSFVGEVFEVPRPMTGEIHLASLFPGLTETPPFGTPMPELPRAEPEPAAGAVSSAAAKPPTLEAPSSSEALVVATPALPALVEPGTTAVAVSDSLEPVPVTALSAPAAQPVRRQRWLLGSALLLLVLVSGGAASYLYLKSAGTGTAEDEAPTAVAASPAASRRSIALLKLRNLSGRSQDSWLATAVPEMLLSELGVGSELRVISGDSVSQTQQSLRIQDTDNPGPETLRRLHDVLGADLLVVGSYTYLEIEKGSQIRIDLRVLEAPGGNTVATVSEEGTRPELFDLVSRAGAKLRQRLGLGAPLSPEQTMATQALRPSVNDEATRLYFKGLERLRSYDSFGALQNLENAANIDPSSAMIHSALVQVWSELGYDSRAAEEAEKAVELAKSLPKDAQFAIQARYWTTKRDWDKAAEIYRSLWTFNPDDLEYGLQLARSYSMGGRGVEAKATIEALRKLPPPEGNDPRIDLEEAELALRLSDYTTQMAVAERAVAKGRKLGEIQVEARGLAIRADGLLLGGQPQQAMDYFEQARKLFERAGNRPASNRLLTHLGVALHEQGQLEKAREMYIKALQYAQRTGSVGGVALLKANLGLLHQDMGDMRQAESLFREAYAGFDEIGDRIRRTKSLYALATVLLAGGDVAGAGQRFNEVLAAARQTGSRLDEARALDGLGQILTRQGKLTAARQRQERAFHLVHGLSNPSQSAVLLASSAEALTRLGELERSTRRLERALAAKREAQDRVNVAQILSSLSQIAYEQGDLAAARAHALEQLRISQETGARQFFAQAHQNLGRIDLAANDLPGARSHLEEAETTARELGATLDLAAIQLDLARLALAQGRPEEAARQARMTADWFRERRLTSDEAQARVVLAEALRREHRLAEAQGIGSQLRPLLAQNEDRPLRIAILVQTARVDAMSGEIGGTLMQLRQAVEQADRLGLVASGLEARLALGTFQLERQDRLAGRALLQTLQKDAEAKGFRRIADLAAQALRAESPRLG